MLTRSQLVLMGTIMLQDDSSPPPLSLLKPTPLSSLLSQVAKGVEWAGTDGGFDILMVQLPPTLPSTELLPLFHALEAVVAAGHARSYGVCAPAFTGTSEWEAGVFSVRQVFAAAEEASANHHLSCVSYECARLPPPFTRAVDSFLFVFPSLSPSSQCLLGQHQATVARVHGREDERVLTRLPHIQLWGHTDRTAAV